MKKPVIKNWLGWNDIGYHSSNKINLERLFSWISKTEVYAELVENTEEDEEIYDNGDDYKEIEPIITKSLEIRDLALFIDNDKALKVMEEERSLARGLVSSGSVDKQNYQSALSGLSESLKGLLLYSSLISVDDTKTLDEAKDKLLKIIPKKSTLNIEGGNYTTVFEYSVKQHFEKIHITKYKKLKNFSLDNLNKINIFAGLNNTGKTSLLEAIFLLTQRNDMSSYFKLIRHKNKCSLLSPVFLNAVFQDKILLNGKFNDTEVSIEMEKYEAVNIDKKDDYIASYKLSSEIDNKEITNIVHTYVHESMKRTSDQVSHLCASSFKSPYFHDIDDSVSDYNKSVELKINTDDGEAKLALNLVIEFMKKVDDSIVDIRYTEEMDIKRFLIDSKYSLDRSFDLTSYGEGIQRIFYTALSFASCRNGVLFIDEYETAIHYSLLKEFTKLTQELSEVFNVQVFLTSHSKECIQAFVDNGYKNDQLTAFRMINDDGKITTKRVDGERFKYLVESIDLDIRG